MNWDDPINGPVQYKNHSTQCKKKNFAVVATRPAHRGVHWASICCSKMQQKVDYAYTRLIFTIGHCFSNKELVDRKITQK